MTCWLVGTLRESQPEQHNVSMFLEGRSVLCHDGDYSQRSEFLGEDYRFILGEVEFKVLMGLKVAKTQSQYVYMSLNFKAAIQDRDKGLTYLR